MEFKPTILPDAMEIERACNVMLAATGRLWSRVSTEEAQALRIMVNGLLLYQQVAERGPALVRFREALDEAVTAQRAAASALPQTEANEGLIKALYRGAMTTSTALAIIEGHEPTPEPEDEGEEF